MLLQLQDREALVSLSLSKEPQGKVKWRCRSEGTFKLALGNENFTG